MKEYTVYEINCHKFLSLVDVFSYIDQHFSYHSRYFAIQDLRYDDLSRKRQETLASLQPDRYAYDVVLPHMAQSPYYDPKEHDRHMLSNLDDRWEWPNKNNHTSLSQAEFQGWIAFCNSLKSLDAGSWFVGVDEIAWEGAPIGQGTYGYQKADSAYQFGMNYLSNSITVGRAYDDKTLRIYLSCEAVYENQNSISQAIEKFGILKATRTFFAPETDTERQEWDLEAAKAKADFMDVIESCKSLDLNMIERDTDQLKAPKINIPKYIKEYLCNNGWTTRKPLPDELPTVLCKESGDRSVVFSILSRHGGHHMNVLVEYQSKKFRFSKVIDVLIQWGLPTEKITQYFDNVRKVRDCFERLL